jgi:predicted nucleic acid-binding Zn ribbon protein
MHPLSQALPGALAALLRDAPLSMGKVEFAWKAAVGPAIGRATSVRLENAVLLVDAASAQWAREVSRSARVIVARLQTLLGAAHVREIVVRHRQ